jgi:hypothetical protein
MYKLVFFVPPEALEKVKNAVFDAGAGKIGNYDRCCWQSPGVGQFRPLVGSHPHVGQQGELELVEEYRVEMVCDERCISDVLVALRRAHPYEEPAYDCIQIAEV